MYLMVLHRPPAPQRLVVGKFMNTGVMPERNRLFALAEQNNSSRCVHPNIVEFIESFQNDAGYLVLVFEFADAGDLAKQIDMRCEMKPAPRPFRDVEVISIVTQIALALSFMHQRNILHRDIKSANVFLTKCGLIKLGDFGLSRQYTSDVTRDVGMTFVGTPYYVAPELWQQSAYSSKADMWSLGVLMYELLAMRKPFVGVSIPDLIQKIRSGVFEPVPATYGYSAEVIDLLHTLLSVDPCGRPSVVELLEHPVIQRGLVQLRNAAPTLPIDASLKQRFLEDVERVLLQPTQAAGAVAPAAVPTT